MKYFLQHSDSSGNGINSRIPVQQFEVLMRSLTTLINLKPDLMSCDRASRSELMLMSYALDHKLEHGEPVTTNILVKLMGTSPPAVSRILKSLSEKGCITRLTDKDDRRTVRVEVTPTGEAKVRGFLECSLTIMNRAFDSFTDEEIVRTIELQQRFVNAIIEVLKEEGRNK